MKGATAHILILTLSFGSGHIRAAENVRDALGQRLPAAELRVVDALENCSLLFRAFYVWTYWVMIRYAPGLWNKFFHSRVQRRDPFSAPIWAWRRGCHRVFREIEEFQPAIIIACEVGACEIAVIARRANLTNAQIINVITDFETEPIWVKPQIAAYAVASEAVAEQLQRWGAEPEKIQVCGIPVSERFEEGQNFAKKLQQFNLDERPVVLLMGGGMGPTRMDETAALLLKNGKNLQIVALPGRDRRTYYRLIKLSDSATVRLRVIAWTEEVAALMRRAAILVTKPGGLTLSEAATCGAPLVLFDAIPGPEETNAAFFVKNGAGVATKNAPQTAGEILRLLESPDELKKMSECCRQIAQPDAAQKIAALIAEQINSVSVAEKNDHDAIEFN